MRIRIASSMVVMVLMVMLAGCGGSGEQAADGLPPPAIGGDSFEIGPMIVQTEKTAGFKAEDIPGNWDCSFVALYGAQINYLASTAMLDRVVFASDRGGGSNIYVCNLDGSGLVRLTNNASEEEWPRWSPCGTKIAFQRRWGIGVPRILTMNANGTGVKALTDDSYGCEHPDWAPTGGQITFTLWDTVGKRIGIMYADGSNPELVADTVYGDCAPAWSPDNTTIAFETTRYGPTEIALARSDGSVTRVTNDSYDNRAPAWHPNGWELCFQSARHGTNEVCTISSSGYQLRNFTASPSLDGLPRYSSDGRYITFTSDRSGNFDIWVQEVSGQAMVLATQVGPVRAWNVTRHAANDVFSDLGSPTVQTERVLIGPNGSDRGGNDPLYPSAPAVIVAFDSEGYRNLVRIGVATAHLASIQIKPFENAGWDLSGVEVSATNIPNLRQDAGWGKPPTVWDFTALNPGMVLLYFHGKTGKLASAVPVRDVVYPSATGADQPAYTSSVQGDSLLLSGAFPAVFDAEGNNLAPDGASSVRIGKDGQVLAVN